jgi:hypothetical protein
MALMDEANRGSDPVRDSRIRDTELSTVVVPMLVREFRRGREADVVAPQAAELFELEPRKAYRWTELVFDQLERSRRWIAIGFAAVMWTGAIGIIAVVVLMIAGRITPDAPGLIAGLMLVSGLIMVIIGVIGALKARTLARLPGDHR